MTEALLFANDQIIEVSEIEDVDYNLIEEYQNGVWIPTNKISFIHTFTQYKYLGSIIPEEGTIKTDIIEHSKVKKLSIFLLGCLSAPYVSDQDCNFDLVRSSAK